MTIAEPHESMALWLLPDNVACDPTEAPDGFYAVPKAYLRNRDQNICRQCDWRAQCNDPKTDLLAHGHRCMSNAVVSNLDGKTYRRSDRCSVVFKLKPVNP